MHACMSDYTMCVNIHTFVFIIVLSVKEGKVLFDQLILNAQHNTNHSSENAVC